MLTWCKSAINEVTPWFEIFHKMNFYEVWGNWRYKRYTRIIDDLVDKKHLTASILIMDEIILKQKHQTSPSSSIGFKNLYKVIGSSFRNNWLWRYLWHCIHPVLMLIKDSDLHCDGAWVAFLQSFHRAAFFISCLRASPQESNCPTDLRAQTLTSAFEMQERS